MTTSPALRMWMVALGFAALTHCTASADMPRVPLPSAAPGVGFDDLRYSASLGRVLVPAGRTGNLLLIDPSTLAVQTISGFSQQARYQGGHDFGVTSVDEGRGLLFATDRTARRLIVIDPKTGSRVGSAALNVEPDYVRYVTATNELWVTEPEASRIAIFSLPSHAPFDPTPSATIAVENGPESLVIDQAAGRAYTHRWQAFSVVIDVRTRAEIARWPNGCKASRGLALDESAGLFFAACSEGKISVLDTRHDGGVLSTLSQGSGFDVIGYNPSLRHLYLAGSRCSCLVVLGVSRAGKLSALGRYPVTSSTHCAVADDHGQAWICDPGSGNLLRYVDTHPASQ